MNHLIRIIKDEDGEPHIYGSDKWHLSITITGDPAVFCTGEFFGPGQGGPIEYQEKTVKRGGITCPRCLDGIKTIKGVKL